MTLLCGAPAESGLQEHLHVAEFRACDTDADHHAAKCMSSSLAPVAPRLSNQQATVIPELLVDGLFGTAPGQPATQHVQQHLPSELQTERSIVVTAMGGTGMANKDSISITGYVNAGAIGRDAKVRTTSIGNTTNSISTIDLKTLADELVVRAAVSPGATNLTQREFLDYVRKADNAAADGDEPSTLKYLAAAGGWGGGWVGTRCRGKAGAADRAPPSRPKAAQLKLIQRLGSGVPCNIRHSIRGRIQAARELRTAVAHENDRNRPFVLQFVVHSADLMFGAGMPAGRRPHPSPNWSGPGRRGCRADRSQTSSWVFRRARTRSPLQRQPMTARTRSAGLICFLRPFAAAVLAWAEACSQLTAWRADQTVSGPILAACTTEETLRTAE